MKLVSIILIVCLSIVGCQSSKSIPPQDERSANIKDSDTVTIANDELEYQIIIIEPGFNFWLQSRARPEGFYSQNYLENRNIIYVTEWNNRVNQPFKYNTDLYEMQIDYQQGIDYGYEVNYKLYNYFIYFQLTYKQQLAGFVPRI